MPLELKLKQGVIAAGISSIAIGAYKAMYDDSLDSPFKISMIFAMYGSSIGIVSEVQTQSLRTEKHIVNFSATPIQSAGASNIGVLLGYIGAKIIEEYMRK